MSLEPLVVETESGRVNVKAAATEWLHDGTLVVKDEDGNGRGEFPTAVWVAHKDHVE